MDMSKYKFYTNDENTVVAVSSYAGRPVRGTAKCDPRDSFVFDKGKEIAAARCNLKVAKKRAKRAHQKYNEALVAFNEAQNRLKKMTDYCVTAESAVDAAYNEVVEIRKNL